MQRSLVLVGALAFLAGLAMAAEPPLTNDDVLKMHNAGLSAETIIAKIKGSATAFRTDTDALVALSNAHVPDAVIKAMLDARPGPGLAVAAPKAEPAKERVDPGKEKATVLGKDVVRSTGLCSARGDLLLTADGLEFVPTPGETMCQGKLFPTWDFNVAWADIDSLCFEYAAFGALVVKTREGKDYTIKDAQHKIQAIERELRKVRPEGPYRCD